MLSAVQYVYYFQKRSGSENVFPGFDSTKKKPDPDPTLIRYEKNIYIYILGIEFVSIIHTFLFLILRIVQSKMNENFSS